MLLGNERESENIEDRRGGGLIKGIGIGSVLLALIGSYLTGVNPATLLGLMGSRRPLFSRLAHTSLLQMTRQPFLCRRF